MDSDSLKIDNKIIIVGTTKHMPRLLVNYKKVEEVYGLFEEAEKALNKWKTKADLNGLSYIESDLIIHKDNLCKWIPGYGNYGGYVTVWGIYIINNLYELL